MDSDLKRVEGQKKVLASMTCKSIAIWISVSSWKCKKEYEELRWALEMERGTGTPIVLHDLIMWINKVIKDSSFTSVKNSFKIMAAKFVPYFEGRKIRKTRKIKI